MSDLRTYYENLIEKINNDELKNFWILCDLKEFKPIKGGTKDKLKKYIKSREQLWDQLLASIDLLYGVNPNKIDSSESDTKVLTIKIYIYKINDQGDFDYNSADTWKLNVSYTKNELNLKKPSYEKLIDNIKMMINLVKNKKITSDLFGISYTEFIEAYNKLKKNRSKRGSKAKSKRGSKAKSKRGSKK